MIVKWFRCKVPIGQRKDFSRVIEKQGDEDRAEGFLGRIGGWNIKKPTEASILAFWQDQKSYNTYMEKYRPQWMEAFPETQKYSYTTVLYKKEMDIPGEESISLYQDFSGGENHLIKIGDVQVSEEQLEHFLLVQQSVWNMSMSHAPGMLTGMFAEALDQKQRFLVLTRWRSEQEYQAYENHLLPKLLHWTYGDDVSQFRGRCIRLVRKWSVL